MSASPVTEKPCPDAAIVVGVITPTVPGTEKAAVYGGVPPVMTKFDASCCTITVGPARAAQEEATAYV